MRIFFTLIVMFSLMISPVFVEKVVCESDANKETAFTKALEHINAKVDEWGVPQEEALL